MHIPPEIQPHYLAALAELQDPSINFTTTLLGEPGFEILDGSPVCERYVEQDYSYLFFFKLQGASHFYRLLVMKDDCLVWSGKLVPGIRGRLRIRNGHNSHPFDEWLLCFKPLVRHTISDSCLTIPLNEHLSCTLDEIVEALACSLREDRQERFKDFSLENDCVLQLELFLPRQHKVELELEKWRMIDLGHYRLGLEIDYVLE